MRKLLVTAAIGGLLLGPLALDAGANHLAGTEGCIAHTGGGPAVDDPTGDHDVLHGDGSCGYTATRGGGWVSDGSWTITVTRAYSADKAALNSHAGVTHADADGDGDLDWTTITFTDATADQNCTSAFDAGDVITLVVTDGGAGVGNPIPSAADDAPDVAPDQPIENCFKDLPAA